MDAPIPNAMAVLEVIARHDAVMQLLGSEVCAIEHVSVRNPDGPDDRLDTCPCARGRDVEPIELGGGQYVSSARHTLADVVRDALGID